MACQENVLLVFSAHGVMEEEEFFPELAEIRLCD